MIGAVERRTAEDDDGRRHQAGLVPNSCGSTEPVEVMSASPCR